MILLYHDCVANNVVQFRPEKSVDAVARVQILDDQGPLSDGVVDDDVGPDLIDPSPEIGAGSFGVVAEQLVDLGGGRAFVGPLPDLKQLSVHCRPTEDEILVRKKLKKVNSFRNLYF
jgi:hypothetical protein